jgi:hypothetical protein
MQSRSIFPFISIICCVLINSFLILWFVAEQSVPSVFFDSYFEVLFYFAIIFAAICATLQTLSAISYMSQSKFIFFLIIFFFKFFLKHLDIYISETLII